MQKPVKVAGNCDVKDCPAVYVTEQGTYLVQGYVSADHGLDVPPGEAIVEVPRDLLDKLARENHG
ncbi:hypothetical protein ACPA54_09005 [Uniformispora flossi]|uniref:hypothetical protein n=1 Tax=Uniformispora flossi TaxID=3390723 RepID=UPI003C2ED992